VLDFLEGERFQAGLFFPKGEILARGLMNIGRQAIETCPKIRPNEGLSDSNWEIVSGGDLNGFAHPG
jgi:hypothetical protein